MKYSRVLHQNLLKLRQLFALALGTFIRLGLNTLSAKSPENVNLNGKTIIRYSGALSPRTKTHAKKVLNLLCTQTPRL